MTDGDLKAIIRSHVVRLNGTTGVDAEDQIVRDMMDLGEHVGSWFHEAYSPDGPLGPCALDKPAEAVVRQATAVLKRMLETIRGRDLFREEFVLTFRSRFCDRVSDLALGLDARCA